MVAAVEIGLCRPPRRARGVPVLSATADGECFGEKVAAYFGMKSLTGAAGRADAEVGGDCRDTVIQNGDGKI